jgi:hypothetical protein
MGCLDESDLFELVEGLLSEERAREIEEHLGQCKPKPTSWVWSYEPVCGCDDITYINDQERLFVGAPLKHKGKCN